MAKPNEINSNKKYLSRCHYYGKLLDWEFVESAMVLKFEVYSATEYFGGSSTIRIYVPTDLEQHMAESLVIGLNYYVIAAPYKVHFKKKYKHRVDLLLQIFEEVL